MTLRIAGVAFEPMSGTCPATQAEGITFQLAGVSHESADEVDDGLSVVGEEARNPAPDDTMRPARPRLAGARPFEPRSLLQKGRLEMLRVIREDEPPRPSARIGTLGDRVAAVARRRHTTPSMLSRSLRGDLDRIVMKALEKDRSRRYATANDLAADIGRHLRDEPVHARPPGAAYRLRKFVRRNGSTVVAASSLAVALVSGVAGSSYGMLCSLAEEEQAARAVDAAARAQRAATTADVVMRFVTTALRSGDSRHEGGRQDMKILAAMENAIREIGSGRFEDDPETEAQLQLTIARILSNNGNAARAEPLLEEALETIRRG